MARLIRGSFQCQTKRQNPDPCGVCAGCIGGNGAYEDIDLTNTSVEDIRNREFKDLLNMHLNQIVFYFDETQRWNFKNQEILLKKVEESDKTTFIFSTTDLNAIEEGLRSRSLVLYLTRPMVEECVNGLRPILEENSIQITDEGIRKMVKLCRQVPRDCLKMLDLLVCETGKITEEFFEQEFIRKSVGAVE